MNCRLLFSHNKRFSYKCFGLSLLFEFFVGRQVDHLGFPAEDTDDALVFQRVFLTLELRVLAHHPHDEAAEAGHHRVSAVAVFVGFVEKTVEDNRIAMESSRAGFDRRELTLVLVDDLALVADHGRPVLEQDHRDVVSTVVRLLLNRRLVLTSRHLAC